MPHHPDCLYPKPGDNLCSCARLEHGLARDNHRLRHEIEKQSRQWGMRRRRLVRNLQDERAQNKTLRDIMREIYDTSDDGAVMLLAAEALGIAVDQTEG